MTPEETEEVIDHILEEVRPHSASRKPIPDIAIFFLFQHGKDPNFPPRVLEAANRYRFDETLRNDPLEYQRVYEELRIEAALVVVNSPYAEVRAVVDNHDDPTMPSSTFRSWFIGIIFVSVGGFINQFFSIRYPGISVGSNVAQLL